MRVKELIEQLKTIDPDKIIVIQKNVESGIMFGEPILQLQGHIGFDGPIIHIGPQICFDDEAAIDEGASNEKTRF